MSKSQAKRIRVQKGWPMSEPTVEEVREALVWFAQATDTELSDDSNEPKLNAVEFAAQKWVDAAEPDIEAAVEARFNYISTSREDVTQIIAAAFGDNTLIRRAE